jgi:hypothetical protein
MKIIFTILLLAISINTFSQISCNGLVGYWPFSGNTMDASGNGYNGNNNGATLTTDRFGNSNSAYHFDGISNFITLNNNNSIINSKEFTISVWAKMDGPGGGLNNQNVLFEQRDDDATLDAKSTILLISDDNNGDTRFLVRSSINTDALYEQATNPKQQYDSWHHYVAILVNDTIRLYIDAVEVGKRVFTQTGDFTTSIDHVDIGSHRHTGGDLRGLFYGDIDDVRIYSRGINQSEITTLYKENVIYKYITVTDTIVKYITITDTIESYKYIAVTDTLVINANLSGFKHATIKIYPNPAKDHVTIDFENYTTLAGYIIKISNSISQTVFLAPISTPQTYIDLRSWSGNGVYLFHLIDGQGKTIAMRKIVIL